MVATLDRGINKIDTKMDGLLAKEKAVLATEIVEVVTGLAVLGPVQDKTTKRMRKR